MLSEQQQIYEALKNSQHTLITFRQDCNGDILASGLALALLLKKLDKKFDIVCALDKTPTNLSFLPLTQTIKQKLTNLRQFIISLDISKNDLSRFNYQVEDGKLNLYVEPGKGTFNSDDVKAFHSKYKYDLIITLNTPDLESLGNLYQENTEFFYQTPILNIDHLSDNEHYGHYNLVKVTATSIAEIIYEIIDTFDNSLIDEEIATCLLTGMIDKTKSFKTNQVTPQSLQVASQLMSRGAKRTEIIKNLYQTKSVKTLKLWGRALMKLQTSTNQKFAWSILDPADFLETQTTADELKEVFDEMITNIPTIELSALFYSLNDQNYALIKSEKKLNLLETLKHHQPSGTKNLAHIKIHTPLENIQNELQQFIE